MKKISIASFIMTLFIVCGTASFAENCYTYDSLGRLKTASYEDGTRLTYTYDLNHNLTKVQQSTGTSPTCGVPSGQVQQVVLSDEPVEPQKMQSTSVGFALEGDEIPRPTDDGVPDIPDDISFVPSDDIRMSEPPGRVGERPRPSNAPLPPNVERVRSVDGVLRAEYVRQTDCSRGACAEVITDKSGRKVAEDGKWLPGYIETDRGQEVVRVEIEPETKDDAAR